MGWMMAYETYASQAVMISFRSHTDVHPLHSLIIVDYPLYLLVVVHSLSLSRPPLHVRSLILRLHPCIMIAAVGLLFFMVSTFLTGWFLKFCSDYFVIWFIAPIQFSWFYRVSTFLTGWFFEILFRLFCLLIYSSYLIQLEFLHAKNCVWWMLQNSW